MTTKQQILKILKEAKSPLKAREIVRRFNLLFNERISKKEINKIISTELRNKISRNPFSFKYSLNEFYLAESSKNIAVQNKQELNFTDDVSKGNKESDKSFLTDENSILKTESQELANNETYFNGRDKEQVDDKETFFNIVSDYLEIFYRLRKYVTNLPDENSRSKREALKQVLLSKKEALIDNILSSNISIEEASIYLEKEELIHKQIIGDKRVIKFIKENGLDNNLETNIIETSTLNSDILVLIQKYESSFSDFIKLNRKPANIKSTFSEIIKELEKSLTELIDLIAKNILTNNISLTDLEDNCSRDLYIKIEKHEEIFNWINTKDEDQSIDLDTYEDRLKEFKILCQKVWEDGIIDKEEQIEIDEKIKVLGLDKKDANEIFEQIKGEYEELHLLDDFVENNKEVKHECGIFDKIINIDNVSFHFKNVAQPMSPLFWHKYENNLEVIYINKTHHQYKDFNTNLICNLVAVLCKTKLSFSDESGEIFENRFKNYLNLINLKA